MSYDDYFEPHKKGQLHFNLQPMPNICAKVSAIQSSWQIVQDGPMLQDGEPDREPDWQGDEPTWQDDEPEWQDNEPNQDDEDDENLNRVKRQKETFYVDCH